MREAIDSILEPYRDQHTLRAFATGALLDAVVSEAHGMFGPELATKFIVEIVNSDLRHKQKGDHK